MPRKPKFTKEEVVEETFGISAENAKKLITSCITQANGIALAIINGFGEDYTEEKLERILVICVSVWCFYLR